MAKKKEKIENWEIKFDKEFGGKIDWLPVKGEIPEGVNPLFVRHTKGELGEVLKEFIRQLLINEKIEMTGQKWESTKHKGFWATFTEDQVNSLKNASWRISEVLRETNSDNRDTQILKKVVEDLDFIIRQQYE